MIGVAAAPTANELRSIENESSDWAGGTTGGATRTVAVVVGVFGPSLAVTVPVWVPPAANDLETDAPDALVPSSKLQP